MDNVRKETSCSFSHDPSSENRRDQRREGNHLLLHQKRRRLTGRYPQKAQAAEERALLEQEDRFRAEISLGESVRIRNENFWHTVCLNYKSEFRMQQLPYDRSLYNWVVCLRFSSEKVQST